MELLSQIQERKDLLGGRLQINVAQRVSPWGSKLRCSQDVSEETCRKATPVADIFSLWTIGVVHLRHGVAGRGLEQALWMPDMRMLFVLLI